MSHLESIHNQKREHENFSYVLFRLHATGFEKRGCFVIPLMQLLVLKIEKSSERIRFLVHSCGWLIEEIRSELELELYSLALVDLYSSTILPSVTWVHMLTQVLLLHDSGGECVSFGKESYNFLLRLLPSNLVSRFLWLFFPIYFCSWFLVFILFRICTFQYTRSL